MRFARGALLALLWTAGRQGDGIRLELNVPAFRLDVVRGDSVVRRFPVAVGMRGDPTPLGEFLVGEVTWNPWWYPPKSAWAAKDTVMPPGPSNPMGMVKLSIGGLYFLHGTPFTASIGHAQSHGCVRMRDGDAIELARIVLGVQPRRITRDTMDDLNRVPGATLVRTLAMPVPVAVRYALVEVFADSLHLYPDVYRRSRGGLAGVALEALARAGVDTFAVDRDALDSLLKRSARRMTTAPLPVLQRRR
ncbi:MAG: L,D-transpeptidase [Gemmatimonadales bacterium]